MKTLADYKKEFEEKFGMFASLGGQRFYNGAVDNGVKIGNQWQFIEDMFLEIEKELKIEVTAQVIKELKAKGLIVSGEK